MARAKRPAALPPAVAQRKVGPRSGLIKVMISVKPEQFARIQAEAFHRAQAAGSLKTDASALIREAIDAWLAKHG